MLNSLIFGFLGGAIFGVLIAFVGWITTTQNDLSLIVAIGETWWYFAIIGLFMGPAIYRFKSWEGLVDFFKSEG